MCIRVGPPWNIAGLPPTDVAMFRWWSRGIPQRSCGEAWLLMPPHLGPRGGPRGRPRTLGVPRVMRSRPSGHSRRNLTSPEAFPLQLLSASLTPPGTRPSGRRNLFRREVLGPWPELDHVWRASRNASLAPATAHLTSLGSQSPPRPWAPGRTCGPLSRPRFVALAARAGLLYASRRGHPASACDSICHALSTFHTACHHGDGQAIPHIVLAMTLWPWRSNVRAGVPMMGLSHVAHVHLLGQVDAHEVHTTVAGARACNPERGRSTWPRGRSAPAEA